MEAVGLDPAGWSTSGTSPSYGEAWLRLSCPVGQSWGSQTPLRAVLSGVERQVVASTQSFANPHDKQDGEATVPPATRHAWGNAGDGLLQARVRLAPALAFEDFLRRSFELMASKDGVLAFEALEPVLAESGLAAGSRHRAQWRSRRRPRRTTRSSGMTCSSRKSTLTPSATAASLFDSARRAGAPAWPSRGCGR